MFLLYHIIFCIALFPLLLAIAAGFSVLVDTEFVFGSLTASIFAFAYIFSDTEDWTSFKWISVISGIFSFGCAAVYLILKIVFEYG